MVHAQRKYVGFKSRESGEYRYHLRFQISLLVLITLIVLLSSAATLLAVLSISTNVSTRKAEELFEEAAGRVEEKLNQRIDEALRIAGQLSVIPGLSAQITGNGESYPAASFMTETLRLHPGLYSLYVGCQDSRFIQIIHAADDSRILATHQAPQGTEFILRAIPPLTAPGGREERWTFLDAYGKAVGYRVNPSPDYRPELRPWFSGAAASGGASVLTLPYIFNSLKEPGITASREASPGIIVGVDITLTDLEGFLESLSLSPGTGLLLLDSQDRVLGANAALERWLGSDLPPLSDVRELPVPRLRLLFESSESAMGKADSRELERETWLFWNRRWTTAGGTDYRLFTLSPLSDFMDGLDLMQRRIILSSVVLLVLLFPLVLLGSRSLSRFLEILAEDAVRIANFNFDGETPRGTVILEFDQLTNAFLLMKQTVKARTEALTVSMTKLERIIQLGITMSVEKDSERLLELILRGAKEISHADGGSLYLKGAGQALDFKIVLNDTLNIVQGGTSAVSIVMPPVPLYRNGEPNYNNVVTCAYHTGRTIAIDDAYQDPDFDFSGTKAFDDLNRYHSTSFLTVPLKVQGGEIIGALQLINSLDPVTGEVVPFSRDIQGFVEALSAEAAVVLSNRNLEEAQLRLFDALIQLIAGAIDTKSPYTGGHCARVPELAMMLADEAERTDTGPLANFRFSTPEDRRAFRIGAWLHDCGKVTTPEFVVDKAVKLETMYNRIHEIRTRFEILIRDAAIEEKKAVIAGMDPNEAAEIRQRKVRELADDFAFVAECNIGTENMDQEDIERLHAIGQRRWFRNLDPSLGLSWEEQERFRRSGGITSPGWEPLLADRPEHIIPLPSKQRRVYDSNRFILPQPNCLYNRGEIYNLSIRYGTLTEEERFKINEHIMQTIVMIERLPLPESLSNVPEYAGTHHETLAGTGYPRGLKRQVLSIPSRIMAIADIFEALTASDRPYKKAKPLSEAVRILHQFKERGLIDPDLFNLFLTSGIYRRYGERYCSSEQLDDVDIAGYIG
jgi:HD-GYP domain-containing protein (c-di-GMP phosphodiesterase class II)